MTSKDRGNWKSHLGGGPVAVRPCGRVEGPVMNVWMLPSTAEIWVLGIVVEGTDPSD